MAPLLMTLPSPPYLAVLLSDEVDLPDELVRLAGPSVLLLGLHVQLHHRAHLSSIHPCKQVKSIAQSGSEAVGQTGGGYQPPPPPTAWHTSCLLRQDMHACHVAVCLSVCLFARREGGTYGRGVLAMPTGSHVGVLVRLMDATKTTARPHTGRQADVRT